MIHRAFDLGINFFDTANEYGSGAAEEVLGKALSSLPSSSYVVATKVYWPMGDGANEWGLSRKHILDQCEASLRRLGLDHIDLYQCHRFDTQRPLEETCQAMDDLIRRGRILYWGVSEWSADQIVNAVLACRDHGWDPPISNQPQYSALWRTIERKILPVSEALGLGTLAFSPLAMGILSGKYLSVDEIPPGSRGAGPSFPFFTEQDTWRDMPYFNQPALDAVQRLRPLAQEVGCSTAQLALAWCLRHPTVSSVITGASKLEQIEDNALAGDLDVESQIFDQMDEILRPVADFSAPTAPNMDS